MLFKKNHLNEVLETTSASMDVFVPAIVDGTSRFALYGEQGEVTEPNFQLQNTKISSPPPKNSTPGAKVLTAPLSTAP